LSTLTHSSVLHVIFDICCKFMAFCLRQLLCNNYCRVQSVITLETVHYRQLEAQRRKERTEAHLYMNVQVLLEDAFFGYQGNDLYDVDRAQTRYHHTLYNILYTTL